MHRVLAGLLGIVVTLVLGEVLIRVLSPKPRAQVVRQGALREQNIEFDEGIPLWYHNDDTARRNWACLEERPDAPTVLFLGDSIFAGVSVPADKVWTRLMEDRWPSRPAPCMLNLAQPGYSFHNELQVAKRAVERFQPDLVVVEYWLGSLWDYTVLHDTAYRFSHIELDSAGAPNPWLNIPALNAWLMPRSRLYEYATLAIAIPMDPTDDSNHMNGQSRRYLAEFHDLATAQGAEMMLVFPPKLDRDFPTHQSVREAIWTEQPGHPSAAAARWAREQGHAVVIWDAELAARGEDYLEIRLDPCCHFNDQGQEVLAEVMLPHIQAALTPPPPPSPE